MITLARRRRGVKPHRAHLASRPPYSMAAPVFYSTGLWSLNSLGDDFLSYTVTSTTFRGPAMVLVIEQLNFDYTLIVDFAAQWNAPLVLVRGSTINGASVLWLRGAYAAIGKFYDSARTRQPRRPTSPSTDVPAVFGGPYIIAGSTQGDVDVAAPHAWDLAITYSRTSQNHPYGAGMQAVSVFDNATNNLSPPVYKLSPGDVAIASDLKTLTKKWQGDAVVTVAQYQALMAAAVARPGLASKINASLIPYVLLAQPV